MTIKKDIIISGIDDATKCPCIGSIFIAGVVADSKIIALWKKHGVKDSKLLTRKKRDDLAALIYKTAYATCIREITPAMIDDKSLNLNEWEMATCIQIIQELQSIKNPDYAYIDNWEVSPIVFWQRLHQLLMPTIKSAVLQTQLIPEHKADEKYIVVGAASILAKAGSDAQYDEYKKIYGDFGSGNPGDLKTRRFLWKNRDNPPPIIRKSWATFQMLSIKESFPD